MSLVRILFSLHELIFFSVLQSVYVSRENKVIVLTDIYPYIWF